MKKSIIPGFVLMSIISITAFAQGGSDGLLMPKLIKPTDNSTSIILTDLSKERHFLKELPAGSEMNLLKDIVFHKSLSIDGEPMSLAMDLLTFRDGKIRPCVVYIIGGGFSFAAKERNLYDRYEVAKAGYVIASIQYHVISNGIYSDAVKDVKAAVRFLRANAKEYGIDPGNIAVWGESAGGYLTAMTGTTNGVKEFEEGENPDQSSNVQAAIDVYGLSDLTKIGDDYDEAAAKAHYSVKSPDGQFIHGKNSGLTSLDKPEVVAKANPISYVDKNDPPFLLFHGTKDISVSPSQTLLLHNALREAGVSSTRYVLEGAGHASSEFSDPRVIKIIINFLDEHLKQSTTPVQDNQRPGPITKPVIMEIAPKTYFINEFGMNAMYLVVGEKRALVIDAGTGFCDFKGIIESLTKLPYDVAITHGHPDHVGGVGQFDEIFIHPLDSAAINISYEQRAQYGDIMRNMNIGYKNVWGYTKDDVTKYTSLPRIKLLHDLQVFDLGGRKVTVYFTPGHSPGECTFIDDKSRILFSGDAANGNVGTRIPVSTTLKYLVRLQKLRSKYDQMYTGHISYAGTINALSQDLQVLDDVIEAFRSILRGDADLQEIQNHLFPERKQTVAVYGRARVGFDPKKLWEEGEKHIIP